MDVALEVYSDRLRSDHHPIIVNANTSDHPVPERVPKWNFKKAKYDAFQDQCITEITSDIFTGAEDKMVIFSSILFDIAADNNPKTSPFPKRKAKPWFDEDFQAAIKERNKANRLATLYPKKYAHGFVVLCFVVVMQSFIMNSHEVFIHIHQGCFAGTGAIVRLPQCQWSKPDDYWKISQCITTIKHSKAKTVCIFLGIYCNKHLSAADLMWAYLVQARTKKLFKQKKHDSWKNYVSSVNINTPSKKVWDMIRKITGKNVASPMHHLKDENGTLITDRVQIANTLGAAIEKSSSENYAKEFQAIKAQKEKQKINFKTNINLRYNKKLTMKDLKRSLKKSNNSSPGPDQIHYEILRHLPIETLHILLDIINETWKSDTIPESWREALITSIPKPGKDHFNSLNYRPIALTNCICKTVERMVNERLVWYLEKNGLLAKQQWL